MKMAHRGVSAGLWRARRKAFRKGFELIREVNRA